MFKALGAPYRSLFRSAAPRQPRQEVHDDAGVIIEGIYDAIVCVGTLEVVITNGGANADATIYLYLAS